LNAREQQRDEPAAACSGLERGFFRGAFRSHARRQPGHQARPQDLETIATILKDMGVNSYDPLVGDQLLEFMHAYTVSVLRDAQFYQVRARTKGVERKEDSFCHLQAHREGSKLELDDARLAIQSRVNSSFTQPPPRELMLELAKERNAQPLDVVPRQFGVLLPPDELALTRPVFQLDLGKK
jgi:transcription initiation factor TFIID subunit 9B